MKQPKTRFTKEQWIMLVIIGSVHFGCAICVSLQAPFYPHEAEKKGATATEYGLVFGIFELVSFIACPILGKYMAHTGVKGMLNTGIFTASSCSILFGLLDLVQDRVSFITLSFMIRIIEALGASAATIAAFALTSAIFPDSVATTFATLEVCYGMGYIIGPLIGGVLYTVGGYITPFVAMGLFLMADAVFIYKVLPPLPEYEGTSEHEGGLTGMLKVPDIAVDTFSIVAAAVSIGFLTATLAPHIRIFDLHMVMTGVMFIISGTMYSVSAPIIGNLCDKWVPPKHVILFGSVSIILAYCLVGPMPWTPLPTTLWMCIIGLMLHGLGGACILVTCFSDILNCAYDHGFPNDISTYGMTSGIWASAFSLGAFIGPSIAGILYDMVGFRIATLFPVGVLLLVFVMMLGFICCKRKKASMVSHTPEETSKLKEHIVTPIDIPQKIAPRKRNDSIRRAGYGSFGNHSTILSILQ